MESQENSQLGSPVHEEITIENSDSDQEADNVRYENEKNAKLVKSYEISPKLNVSNNSMRSNNMAKNHAATLSRPKPSEWDIVTHVKLTEDNISPFSPLCVKFKEPRNPNIFFCLSKSEEDRKEGYQKMVDVYNAWRKVYNDTRGYITASDNFEKTTEQIASQILAEEINIDRDQNEDEKPTLKTPDITDNNDFPTLGGRSNTSSRSNANLVNKPSSSKQVEEVVDVDVEEYEEKDDPDDQDFIPSSLRHKKNNKKTVYKKATSNIFDFDENATAWQSTKEVSSSKSTEPKNTQNVPEPISNEEKVACPICNKQFPMSQIETHASDCLSFEDAVPLSSRTRNLSRNPPPVDNIEDAILISDDDDITKSSSILLSIKSERHAHKSTTKRLLTDGGDVLLASPTKKFCPSSKL